MPTWIRVRDPLTGHEFDVAEQSLPSRPGLEVLDGYPPNTGPSARPRPAKHLVDKGGQPATPKPTTPTSDGPATPADTTKE